MYFRRKTAFSIVKMLTLNKGSDTLNAERNLYTNLKIVYKLKMKMYKVLSSSGGERL